MAWTFLSQSTPWEEATVCTVYKKFATISLLKAYMSVAGRVWICVFEAIERVGGIGAAIPVWPRDDKTYDYIPATEHSHSTQLNSTSMYGRRC